MMRRRILLVMLAALAGARGSIAQQPGRIWRVGIMPGGPMAPRQFQWDVFFQRMRELGYAEIMPVVGRYEMDEEDGLVLLTEYETMSSRERFWFANDNTRVRTSTVKRFGGFSSATFCSETRVSPSEGGKAPTAIQSEEKVPSVFGW